MNRFSKSIALFLLLGCGVLRAETFTDSAIGVSLTAPDGWKHDDKDPFGYVIRDPSATGEDRIRLHLVTPRNSSPEEAVKLATTKLQDLHNLTRPVPEELLASKPVVTTSGMKGYKGSFGTKDSVVVNRYYFQKPDGTTFCVRAYVAGNPQTADNYEKIILGSLRLVDPAQAAESTPTKEQKASYAAESFFAPRLTLSISTLRAKGANQDVFVQLLEQPDKRVLTSLHWPGTHHVAALWNPDSSMVAVNYQVDNDAPKLKVFRVSTTGLTEIPLAKALLLKKIAPKAILKDENVSWDEITASKWKSPDELFCLISGTAKDQPAATTKRGPATPTPAAIPLTFEVLISLNGKDATVLSSIPVAKKAK